jgi:hypothetical protein
MAALDATGGGINIPVGQVYVKYNDDENTNQPYANFKIYQRKTTGATTATSSIVSSSTFTSGTNSFTVTASQKGSKDLPATVDVIFTAAGADSDANLFVSAFNNAVAGEIEGVVASVTTLNQIVLTHQYGGDIRLDDAANAPLNEIFTVGTTSSFYADPASNGSDGKYIITAWASATATGTALVTPSVTAPSTTPEDGTYWYDTSTSEVDIMVNTGSAWVGYRHADGILINQIGGSGETDVSGPIILATQPTAQRNGDPLAHGDLWINSSNTENWPTISKYNFITKKWTLLDGSDQTTQDGVVFADARWGTTGADVTPASITALLESDFVDPDAPDPALYPRGILLYNLRRSGYNVKKYVAAHISTDEYNTRFSDELMTSYNPSRWVTAAANDYRGVGQFGRKAQRAVVVQALNALIQSNQNIRNEDSLTFNLLSCPGYLETLPALRSLNTDRGLLSFIVADAPARLTSDATSLNAWGKNVNTATSDGEAGLVSTDANSAVYYPWGYTTDLQGNNIVVPPSHMMLRTIALNDQVAYPWFAPAGTRRGGITNASSVGYVDGQSGEFIPVSLNNGQRDTLAGIHVNPITYLGGIGLVAYGQYTRQLVASALDRINVARLVIYLRYQLNTIAKPYIFEPNDTITRNEIRNQINAMLLDLTSKRALYDYLVVCDTSNNTPSRIDANELHVDIAIEPVKAVEFIYIPLRLENTGAIKGLSSN